MKKRILGWICMCALMVSMLAACGTENYDKLLNKTSSVTITVWHYYNGVQQTQFDEMVNEFNNTVGSEKGIVVEAYSKNSVNELAQSVLASVKKEPGADDIPNIFATYAETAYQIDKLGMLADLSQYFQKEELDEYVEEYIEEGAFSGEGTLKIFPTAKSTEVMMLNLTDWQEFAQKCSVSYDNMKTWEGLADVARKYYEYTDELTPDVPNDGKAFFGRDSVANYMFVGAKQLGNGFVSAAEDKTVKVSVDKATLRTLWDNFYVPFVKGYYTAESRFRTDDAKIGNVIALIGSTTGATYYPSEVTINDEHTHPIENVVLPVPNFQGCDPYIVQQGAGMSVIKSDKKTEYACAVFLKWFTEADRNIQFAVNSGYLPVKKSANDFNGIMAHSGAEQMNDTMRHTFQTAIEEINSYTLYTSMPYDKSADVRDYLGNTMESTAKKTQENVKKRLAAGEDRESVWNEYTDDEAFEVWFAEFMKGFNEIVGE